MYKQYVIALFFGFLLFAGCKKNDDKVELDYISAEEFKIYVDNETDFDILVVDAFETNNGIVVFGVKHTSLSTKFDNIGELYVLEFSKDKGDFKWSKVLKLAEKGFPANILKKSDTEFVVFWNVEETNSAVFTLTLPLDTEPVAKNISYDIVQQNGFVVAGINASNSDNYYLMKLSSVDINSESNKQVLATKFDQNFTTPQKFGDLEYDPSVFGSYGGSNLAFYKDYVNYMGIFSLTETQALVCCPYQNGMCLTYLLDGTPIYYDESMFISALEVLSATNVAVVVNNPKIPGEPPYLIPNLELNSTIQSFAPFRDEEKVLVNIDVQEKIMIKKTEVAGENYLFVAGTGLSGNVSLNIFSENGELKKTHTFGTFYSYKLDKLIDLDNGSMILVGTTDVAYKIKRVFMIKVKKTDLI